MTLDQIRNLCLSFPNATEGFPFDATTLVFKIGGKMFLLVDTENPSYITLKCSKDAQAELVESNLWISPGFHMNKSHWITVDVSSEWADQMTVRLLIKDSFGLVHAGLPKKVKEALENR